MLQPSVLRALGVFSAIALAAVSPLSAQTQGGQVTGTVTSQETGGPVGAVQVYLDGTGRASITRADGTFSITNVPPGTYTLVAQSIGYQPYRQSGVQVAAGATVPVSVQLATNVLAIQGIVATGLVDPVEGARSPITVGQVTREQMPVSAASADPVTQLQGKVAGVTISRTSGQPGQDAQVRLRTPTSALQSNRPLYVVDGVILGTNAVDIDSSDIESIEVVKGAAAASLYGSRAAAGVIAITTNRGRGVAAGETRFAFNSEIGQSAPADFLVMPTHHQFSVNAAGELVGATGQPVVWANRYENPRAAFLENPFPAGFETYNNLREIYRPGGFNTQTLSMTSNSETTNLAVSVNRLAEMGALEGNAGYSRMGFRTNIDHRFRETLQLGISAYHARSFRDDLDIGDTPGGVGGLLGDFFLIPPYINLSQRNEQGEYPRYATFAGEQVEHPIWRQLNRDSERNAARTLGNATLRWNPLFWFTGVADVSFDREDRTQRYFVPKGIADSNERFDGRIAYNNDLTDTFNGSLQGSVRRDFGPLNSRTTVRGIMERVDVREADAIGENFFVQGVQSINATTVRKATSEIEEIRSTGYLIDQAFDYDGKYILSALGRRDGSSLFGVDNRWHNYYRVAGAWRLGEEPWFALPNVSEFKLKASRGTAGGRPNFAYQYETWTLRDGVPTKGTLGNNNLRPEHTTENEVGLEMILFDRVSLELVHARQQTEHQLVNLNLPGAVGYTSQWINAGTLEGSSTEMSIEAQVLSTPRLTWSTNIVADRSTSRLAEWSVPCRVVSTVNYLCEGTNIRDIYGYSYLTSIDQLPEHLAGQASQFQVNDDGFVVWVGEGGSFQNHRANWGRNTNIGGQALGWGLPVINAARDETGAVNRTFGRIGQGDPDFQIGWQNNLTFGGFRASAQLHASVGGEVYNLTKHYMIFDRVHPVLDQAGKAEENRKPIQYYVNGLYNGAVISNAFVEDASYLKLRALSLTYNFGESVLRRSGLAGLGASRVEIGLIGRNLISFDNYSGFDPEVVINASRLTPLDFYQYPQTAHYTLSVGLAF